MILEDSASDSDAESTETAAENNISTSERTGPSYNVITDEDDKLSSRSNLHDFDLALTAAHSYLGTDLQVLRGRTFLDEGLYMKLPVLARPSILLFPGQTLPMTVLESNLIDMLEKCIQKDRTFGVICVRKGEVESIGTTAEIYEYLSRNSIEGFSIKAKGRQRFRTLKVTKLHNEMSANVKIVPEINLPHPFLDQRIACLDNFRVKPTNKLEVKRQNRVEMLDSAVTRWPSWVYKQYDSFTLSRKIHEQLQFIETRGSCIPRDPTDLSFWVAQNIPLSYSDRLMLLKYDCAISRLQWELKYLVKDRVLVCVNCERKIGLHSNIFPMSRQGPQNTFCNPGGFIHDTVTLYLAKNLRLDPVEPSTHYSWFPGYAWTIASCKNCSIHIGWLFTADDKNLRPQSFWALTRSHLKSKKLSKGIKQSCTSGEENDQTESDDEDEEEDHEEEENGFSIN